MTDKKIWFITGAGRGMGVHIVQAGLAAGDAVVATGRNTGAVAEALGEADDLLVVKLDVTSQAYAEATVQAAVDRFGRIDVLVNNAGNFEAGYLEELTPEQIERQLATTLGPMNVTRAVLPIMRKQRSGHVVTISSSAGLAGFDYGTAYAASKFGLEGWMESLALEVEPFGIHTTIVTPASSASSCSPRSRRTTPSRPSTTTPNATRPSANRGRRRTANSRATRLSSPRRSSRLPTRSNRRAASSPARTRSASPSRRSPLSRSRSTPTATCRRRWLTTT